MSKEQILSYTKSQIEEFSTSAGDVDGIALIEHVTAKFGITPREAEAIVDEALGYDE